ncbi:hypothetical protein ES677_05205 [Bizionia gelidisalsuginis]|uniref:Uncharacterized protein n=1 Tax=Bizionia gelidisalsuginis TaxID=291188 RepID=A0ABY3MBW3_9FLAO|nr:hypothetical protein [Bizionia gelidisalsuginis]TYC14779.1 hypothetical protein ES677_05205 [Bizionia gelidisalsuginis]
MNTIKNISFFIVIGIVMTILGKILDSDFLFMYLKESIIGLLLTLLAINTATSGLIASKIQDIIVNQPKIDFSDTIKEMKRSLLEQIILISLSIITLLLMDSTKLTFLFKVEISNVILVSILAYSINILWDTGKAVFVIIEELHKLNKEK